MLNLNRAIQYTNPIRWPRSFTRKAIGMSIALILLLNLLFSQFYMPFFLLIFGIGIISFFFLGLDYFSREWGNISVPQFYKKLFWLSFFFRLIFVGYLYLLTLIYIPQSWPFEISAADSWTYNGIAKQLIGHIYTGDARNILSSMTRDRGDWGYPFYQGILYSIFGPYTFPVRLLNCLWGSITVVLLARISRYIFGLLHARLTGIIAMLMPSLMWFGGRQLKETVMIFMVVLVIYEAIMFVEKNNLKFIRIIIIIFFSFLLFYFRTVLAILTIGSVALYFSLNLLSHRRNKIIVSIGLIFLIYGFGMFSQRYNFIDPMVETYEDRYDYRQSNLESKIKVVRNISVKKAVIFPIMTVGAVLSPFPSFLNLEERQLATMAHSQNEVVRNIMFYFFFLGLFISLKKGFNRKSLPVIFVASYLVVTAISGTSIFDRFQLPALPFIIIIMSSGFIDSKKIWIRRWNYYLIGIILVMAAWNIFKLNIRGII